MLVIVILCSGNAGFCKLDINYITRYKEHFGSFPQNSLNGGVQYNEPSIQRTNFTSPLALR